MGPTGCSSVHFKVNTNSFDEPVFWFATVLPR